MIEVGLKGVNRVRKQLASGKIKTFYYHRATGTRLPDDPASLEFLQAYTDAQSSLKSTGRNRGTLKELIQKYIGSEDFLKLRPRTSSDYRRQIIKIENAFGDVPIDALNDNRIRSDFLDWRDRLAKSSKKQADYAISVLGIILAWSVDRGLVAHNFAARPGKLYQSQRYSIVWTKEDIEVFASYASPELELALVLARDTGQRQGDLLSLTWSAYDGNYIKLKQSKTGRAVEIPVTNDLRTKLEEYKSAHRTSGVRATTILTRSDGQPWRVDHFRHAWREVTLRAGLDGKRFQDLRGTTVTALADAGCTSLEIAAITGHSPKSVDTILEHYLAHSRRRADNAIFKLENAKRTKTANQAANCSNLEKPNGS